MDLSGKRYWLVGASEGLGRELARQLSGLGVRLVVSARTEKRLEALSAMLPTKVDAIPMDVADVNSVKDAIGRIGHIDGIIYCAGLYTPTGPVNWDPERVEEMADVNFNGALRVLGRIVPQFLKQNEAHIVIIGSLSGFRGLPRSIGYSSSKAGLMHLAECLHADLRHTKIQVQLLNPGFIQTRLTEKNDFTMPFLMKAEYAAARCIVAMQKNGFQYNFPLLISLILRGANFLPASMYYKLFGAKEALETPSRDRPTQRTTFWASNNGN